MARRAGFPQVRTRSRRLTTWDEGVGGGAPVVESATITRFLGSALQFSVDGLTLVRTRGQFMANLGSGSAASSGFFGAVGIGLATAAAVAVGITAVPTPITEQGWDGWIWWMPVYCFAGRADEVSGPLGGQRTEIDTKGMRKITEDDALYAALEVTEVGASSLNVALDCRMLFKLP